MNTQTLYAWGRPLSQTHTPVASNLDHTWVTNFPEKVNPDEQPDPPKDWEPPESYWYCWGAPHRVAKHGLGEGQGDLDIANSISPYNVKAVPKNQTNHDPSSTSGSIVYYALDGVCHHVANQILCSTATETSEPMRVQEAKGYPLSTFFYGTYGLNTSAWEKIQKEYLPNIQLPSDDFLIYMNQFVPESQQDALLKIRQVARDELAVLRALVVKHNFNYYPGVAAINIDALHKANKLLDHDVFIKLFPSMYIEDKTWMMPPT